MSVPSTQTLTHILLCILPYAQVASEVRSTQSDHDLHIIVVHYRVCRSPEEKYKTLLTSLVQTMNHVSSRPQHVQAQEAIVVSGAGCSTLCGACSCCFDAPALVYGASDTTVGPTHVDRALTIS